MRCATSALDKEETLELSRWPFDQIAHASGSPVATRYLGPVAAAFAGLVAAASASAQTSPPSPNTPAPAVKAPAAAAPAAKPAPSKPAAAPVKATPTQAATPGKPTSPTSPAPAAAASTSPNTAGAAADTLASDPCTPKIVAARSNPKLEPTSADAPAHAAAYLAYDQGRYTTALTLAEAAAAKGDPQAHTLVARIYDEGFGITKDTITAARWYARAAQLCDVPAIFTYGLMLAEGRGVGKDRLAAGHMLELAALSGHALANYNLGLLFLRGDGKPENPYRAAQHIRYAAEKGVAAAQYDIAVMYQNGAGGLPNDGVEASRWMNRAAVAGHTPAQYDYAVMLLRGLGLERDKGKAVIYMRAAAEKGVPGAQNRLAHMYKDGVAVDPNPVEALKWRLIAKPQVDDPAIDAEFAKLSRDDRRAGEKAAADWRLKEAAGFE